MPLELKGLKAKAIAARAHHERLLKAYDAFNVAAPAHAAEVEGLSEEITEMASDLAFAVGLGGNGGGSAGHSEPAASENAPAAAAANPDTPLTPGSTAPAEPGNVVAQ